MTCHELVNGKGESIGFACDFGTVRRDFLLETGKKIHMQFSQMGGPDFFDGEDDSCELVEEWWENEELCGIFDAWYSNEYQ